ncbi:hypothetical protein AKJ16_DCAP19021 [Drosera capensis]
MAAAKSTTVNRHRQVPARSASSGAAFISTHKPPPSASMCSPHSSSSPSSAFSARLRLLLNSIAAVKMLSVRRNIDVMRARLHAVSWMNTRKLSLGSIPLRLHALLDKKVEDKDAEDKDLADATDLVGNESLLNAGDEVIEVCDDDDAGGKDDGGNAVAYDDHEYNQGYGDSMVDDADEDMDGLLGGSIIEMAKRAKENEGQDFSLEGEIDHVADLFIKSFHKQIRLQKMESFKRYKEMLERGT